MRLKQPNRSPFARPDVFHRPDHKGMGTEEEVSWLIAQHVACLRPKLVVETGTFVADTALPIVSALKANDDAFGAAGAGRLITYEVDEETAHKALDRLQIFSPRFYALRQTTVQFSPPPAGIDIAFIDSAYAARMHDIRTLAPLMSPRGLMFVHDADMQAMIDPMFALEKVFNVIKYPTPRGLALLQPRVSWDQLDGI